MNDKTVAKLNSKKTWVTLWVFALAGMLLALRALSLIKPKTCIAMCVVALAFCVAGTLVGLYAGRTRLEVEEKFVCCKTFLGKQIHLPTDVITGVKTTAFNTVCISSPSCKITCPFVKNKDEIVTAVKEQLEKR